MALEDNERTTLTSDDVYRGIKRAVDLSAYTYLDLYRKAVTGTKKGTLWKSVVLACARARIDDLGLFSSGGVLDELKAIVGPQVIQQTITYHLGKLIESDRGPLLERIGQEKRYRYRFSNPMMRPFIIMVGLSEAAEP